MTDTLSSPSSAATSPPSPGPVRLLAIPLLPVLNGLSLVLSATALALVTQPPSPAQAAVLACWLLWVPGWLVSALVGERPVLRSILAFPFSVAVVLIVSVTSLDRHQWNPVGQGYSLLLVTSILLGLYLVFALIRRSPEWRSVMHLELSRLLGRGDVLPLLLGAAGTGAIVSSVAQVDPNSLSFLGLATALPLLFYFGLAACAGGFLCGVTARRGGQVGAGVCLAVVTVVTSSWSAVTEEVAGQPIAWLHVGLVRRIEEAGAVIPNYDTRFSWPGFFSGMAFVAQWAGLTTIDSWVRFAPAVLGAGIAVVFAATAWHFWRDSRKALWATIVFQIANWVGQDYFSPQGVAIIIALGVVAALLALAPDRDEDPPSGQRLSSAEIRGVLLVTLVSVALAPSHQLTPLFLAFWLLGLRVLGHTRNDALFLVPMICAFVWFVVGARDFWRSQLNVLFRDVGAIDNSISTNFTDRVAATEGQLLVTVLRLGLAAVVLLLAMAGALLLRRRRRLVVGLLTWTFVPFSLLLVQSYGGEMLLRCFLFSLVGASLLAAHVVTGAVERARRLSSVRSAWRLLALPATAIIVGAIFATVLVRGGNDGFNGFSPADQRGVALAYASAQPGGTLFGLTTYAPFRSERIDTVRQATIESRCPVTALTVVCVYSAGADVLFITPAQDNYGVIRHGLEPGWTRLVIGSLVNSGTYSVVVDEGDVTVLRRVSASARAFGGVR